MISNIQSPTKTSWKFRRRTMFAVLAFCKLIIALSLFTGRESVAEIAIVMSFGTIVMIVGSYVFGAVWDDKNILGSSRQ